MTQRKRDVASIIISLLSLILILFGLITKNSSHPFLLLFSPIYIQIGTTVLIAELFVNSVGRYYFREQIKSDIREILGINNSRNKLLPELIHLFRAHPYHVLSNKNETILSRAATEIDDGNLNVTEVSDIEIEVKEDNCHYRFIREKRKGVKSKMTVYLEGQKLKPSDLDYDQESGIYQIRHKLKIGNRYKIKIEFYHENLMDDLSDKDEDWFGYEFIELTNKFYTTFVFPFTLDKYDLFVRKVDACNRITPLKFNITKNKINVSSENLYNGDIIKVIYRKR